MDAVTAEDDGVEPVVVAARLSGAHVAHEGVNDRLRSAGPDEDVGTAVRGALDRNVAGEVHDLGPPPAVDHGVGPGDARAEGQSGAGDAPDGAQVETGIGGVADAGRLGRGDGDLVTPSP